MAFNTLNVALKGLNDHSKDQTGQFKTLNVTLKGLNDGLKDQNDLLVTLNRGLNELNDGSRDQIVNLKHQIVDLKDWTMA